MLKSIFQHQSLIKGGPGSGRYPAGSGVVHNGGSSGSARRGQSGTILSSDKNGMSHRVKWADGRVTTEWHSSLTPKEKVGDKVNYRGKDRTVWGRNGDFLQLKGLSGYVHHNRVNNPFGKMSKGGQGSGNFAHEGIPGHRGGSAGGKGKAPETQPAKRKLSNEEAFKYYVKIKSGDFGQGIEAKLLNSKVGRCEGIAKAYREKAGKLPKGEEQRKLLLAADKLYAQAQTYASQRDSLLGRPAYKFIKKEGLTLDEVSLMIGDNGFDLQMIEDIELDTGLDLSEFKNV